jgi:hypothetical protein
MNTFNKKALLAAVAAGFGAAGSAQAVFLNPDNTGNTLIYPYYTVQNVGSNSFNTYLSVVNTTANAKVVKVRFKEGRNSQEVIDFNLYLSPNDVWTGAVVPIDATDASAGRLITADKSCTNPAIPATGVDFRNYAFSGAADDAAGTTLARTREGYVEMYEMAILTGTSATNVTHNANGTPVNCALVQGQIVVMSLGAPTGGLSGQGTLINVNSGADFGYVADALAQFQSEISYTDIPTQSPNMGTANPQSFAIAGGTGNYDTWLGASGVTAGAQAVSAVYMHSAVLNEYVLDSATLSNTDWVLTFPTKSQFVSTVTAVAPFSNVFTATGACELVAVAFSNREERGAAVVPGDFSPPQPAGPANAVCWESTVVSFRNGSAHTPGSSATATAVLGSRNFTGITLDSQFQNGWATIQFAGVNALGGMGSNGGNAIDLATGIAAGRAAATYYGLPVSGFMVRTFQNGTAACGTATCQANYGSLFRHAYRTFVTP